MSGAELIARMGTVTVHNESISKICNIHAPRAERGGVHSTLSGLIVKPFLASPVA
jgi:hypothetical protein